MKGRRREQLAGGIVVWIAQLSHARDSLSFMEPLLDSSDRERADRFKFADDRARFVLGRGLLKKCLGYYLEQPPESIAFAFTDLGRPVLPNDETIQFNLSHSHDLVALALTANAQVGIDVELVQLPPDLSELAKRIFSERDLRAFKALPADEVPSAFYRTWTRKEAYLKARGEGITEGLTLISVPFGPEKINLVTDTRDSNSGQTWHVTDLPVPSEYRGCIASDSVAKRIVCQSVYLEKGEILQSDVSDLK